MDADAHESPPSEWTAHPPGGSSPWTLPPGWVAIARNDSLTELVATGSWAVLWTVLISVSVTNIFLNELAVQAQIAVWSGSFVVGLLLVSLWFRFRPSLKVNFDTSIVRKGRRAVPMSNISWAAVVVGKSKKSRAITVQFGTGTLLDGSDFARRALASYVVRSVKGTMQPLEQARLMAEVLRRSDITVPQTPKDAVGNSSWFDLPGVLTREQAVDIVLDPSVLEEPGTVIR
jgi:hypothetical protein